MMIRRAHDSLQLAVIQPHQRAVFAIVDHDISRPAIQVRIHQVSTLRTTALAIQILPIRWTGRIRRGVAPRTKILHDVGESIHPDQHPAAALAIPDAVPAYGRMRQPDVASRAGFLGWLEHSYSVLIRSRKVDVAAILASEELAVRFKLHRRAAIRTVHLMMIGRIGPLLQT